MEIKCPQCTAPHNTEDYQGAFEIQCSCGYSILLPDEDDFSEDVEQEEASVPDFKAPPAAMEELDELEKIKLESPQDANPDPVGEPLEDLSLDSNKENTGFSAENMTSPADLPDEMPYDPFEIPQDANETDEASSELHSLELDPMMDSGPEENEPEKKPEDRQLEESEADQFADSPPFDSPETNEGSEDSSLTSSPFANIEEPKEESNEELDDDDFLAEFGDELEESKVVSPIAEANDDKNNKEDSQSKDSLVSRIQLAELGHFLGSDYDLNWEGLRSSEIKKLQSRCHHFLQKRPWLLHEIKKRNINLEKQIESNSLKNLPELLALEIYMACFELGGRCDYL